MDWPVVGAEAQEASLLENVLVGSVKAVPKPGEPVVVMATGEVVVDVVVFIFMVSQQVGVEVAVGEPGLVQQPEAPQT